MARLAFLAAVLAGSLAVAGTVSAAPSRGSAPSAAKVVALHEAMDELWTDHVAWTRSVIVDFAAGAPDLEPDLARLLRNQVDIGNAIKPYYGAAAGAQLTRLLRTHIMEAVPVLTAAKEGNAAALRKAMAAWQANARQIADFLAAANPKSWHRADMRAMMATHLQLTTDEAAAHLEHHWAADIKAYDEVRGEILSMADMLAQGIVDQFPAKFA